MSLVSMTDNLTVTDNALPEAVFSPIKDILMDDIDFPWYRQTQVSGCDERSDHYFTHNFYWNNRPNSDWYGLFEPVISLLGVSALIRIKANLYPQEATMRHHAWHRDFESISGARNSIIYVNTNDGMTEMEDGTVVVSVANRLATFGNSILHRSSVCTDALARITVNINYF